MGKRPSKSTRKKTKKIPTGIILTAISNFILGILMLSGAIYNLLLSLGIVQYKSLGDFFPKAMLVISIIMILFSVILIIIGINLLRAKASTRKIEIGLNIFLIIIMIASLARNTINANTAYASPIIIINILILIYLVFSKKAKQFFIKNK